MCHCLSLQLHNLGLQTQHFVLEAMTRQLDWLFSNDGGP